MSTHLSYGAPVPAFGRNVEAAPRLPQARGRRQSATPGVYPARPIGRAVTLLVVLACTSACVPEPQQVVINAGPRPRVVKKPDYIVEGANVHVVVRDSVYANTYRAHDTATAIEPVPRAPLSGAGASALGKLANGIPLPFRSAAAGGRGIEKNLNFALPGAGILEGETRLETAVKRWLIENSGAAPLRGARLINARKLLVDLTEQRDEAVDSAEARTETAIHAAGKLNQLLVENPEQASVLSFMRDEQAHRLADQLANDPAPREASRILLATTTSGRISVSPKDLHGVLDDAERYSRMLGTLLTFVPAQVTAPSDSLRTLLEVIRASRTGRAAAITQAESLQALAQQLAGRIGAPADAGSLPGFSEIPPTLAVGEDISTLVDPARTPDLKLLAVREDLLTIQRQSDRLVSTLEQLPRWTVGPAEETVLTQRFYGSKEVKLTVIRRPRFGTFELQAEPAPTKTSTSGGNAAAGKATAGNGATEEGSNEKADAATPAPREIKPPKVDTIAVMRIPVVKRSRFHLGAGLLRSPLDTETFSTTSDTTSEGAGVHVRRTGAAPYRLAPAAVLSYSILPRAGKLFDGRAYDVRATPLDYLRQAGLAAQIGLSMTNPTEEFFFGASTEPFPGLMVGLGYHTAYVETSEHAGKFLPNSSGLPATEKQWRGEWGAWTVSIDAELFASVFAGLLK